MEEYIIHILTEAEIAYLVLTVVDEYVGWFEIPMYHLLANQLPKPQCYLPNNLIALLFGKPPSLLQVLLQITILTEFHDDVQASLGVQHFIQLYDVGMFEFAENLNLGVYRLLEVGVLFEYFEVDLFYGHSLLGGVLEAFVDLAEGALAQALRLVVAVAADHL